MKLSSLRRQLYRGARDLGDVQAAAKGPTALSKRLVRKQVYKRSNRLIGKALKGFGL